MLDKDDDHLFLNRVLSRLNWNKLMASEKDGIEKEVRINNFFIFLILKILYQ